MPSDNNISEAGLPIVNMRIGRICFTAEMATTPESCQKGLMFRESLPEYQGMYFDLKSPDYHAFYMKNTKIPLSIAFIRQDGTICDIYEMRPLDENTLYRPHVKAVAALEMKEGWFDRHKIKIGDKLEIFDSE